MPKYDYMCDTCGKIFEVRLPFGSGDTAVSCPACGNGSKRVLTTAPAINFHWWNPYSSPGVTPPKHLKPVRNTKLTMEEVDGNDN